MDRRHYAGFDAVGLADLVARRLVTPAELAAVALDQHQHTHEAINAVVEWYDPATVPASAGDHGGSMSAPLAGVPFLRKDIGSTEAGRLVECGSRLAVGFRASTTSPYFEAMAAAGVQVLGRTAVPEFAQHGTTESDLVGPTRNPLDLTTSAGGSSGGAAAAVRAGVVPIAHASDSAGSIRIPAAVTGLLGLKPTRGRVPGRGFDWSGLLVELVVARSVRDLQTCLAVLSAPDGTPGPVGEGLRPVGEGLRLVGDGPTAGPRCRIALSLGHWAGGTTDPTVVASVEATARALESAGHVVEPIDRPFDYEQLTTTWFPLFGLGIAEEMSAVSARTGRPMAAPYLEPTTCELLERVAALPSDARPRALATGAAVTDALVAGLAGFDALLTPTLDRAVIPLGRMAGHCPMDRYLADGDEWFDRLYLANVTGWPALSVPAPGSSDGPGPAIGAQLMAPPGHDELLLSLAVDIMGHGIIPAVLEPT